MEANLTVAEQYAQLKEKQFETFLQSSFAAPVLKKAQLFEVKVPSGMIFKCRKLTADYFSNAGSLPMALSNQMIASDVTEKPDAVKLFNSMSSVEKRANVQASAQMVRFICVEPRLIVGEVNGHKNAISVDMLTMADFGHLTTWASNGGDSALGLQTFRRKRK